MKRKVGVLTARFYFFPVRRRKENLGEDVWQLSRIGASSGGGAELVTMTEEKTGERPNLFANKYGAIERGVGTYQRRGGN